MKKTRITSFALLFCVPLFASSCFIDSDDDDGDPEDCQTSCEDAAAGCRLDCDDADDACRIDCDSNQSSCVTDCD